MPPVIAEYVKTGGILNQNYRNHIQSEVGLSPSTLIDEDKELVLLPFECDCDNSDLLCHQLLLNM